MTERVVQMLSARQRELAEAARSLVMILAKTIAPKTHVPFEDLVSAGNEAAVRSALRFEPELGVPFNGYAFKRVQGAMLKVAFAHFEAAKLDRILNGNEREKQAASTAEPEPTTEEPDAPRASLRVRLAGQLLTGMLAESASNSAEDLLSQRESHRRALAAIDEVLRSLPLEERELIQAYYFDGLTIDETAERIKTSRATTRRMHERVKIRLAKRLAQAGVTEATVGEE